MASSTALCLGLLLLAAVAGCRAQETAATYVPSWAPFWARPLYSAQLQLEMAEMQRDDLQGGVDLIVLGDSMTEVLRGTMLSLPCNETALRLDCKRLPGVFDSFFGQYSYSVQSVAGDRVESLIWRMEHGSLPTLHQPKVVVMLIGTNDLHNIAIDNWDGKDPGVLDQLLADAAPIVTRRMKVAVRVLRQRLPDTQLVLMALLPRGSGRVKPADDNSNWRWPSFYTEGLSIVNTRLRAFAATQPRTHFLDCGHPFFTHGGTELDTTLLPDGMHFSAKGLEQALGPCLKPAVDELMHRLFGLSYESVGEGIQRSIQSRLHGGAGGGLLGSVAGMAGGAAGAAGGPPAQVPRWERELSAAAQQVRRVYGHKQQLADWLASASVAAEDGEALLEGIAALCQDQVSAAPNWPPGKAARALRTLLEHSAAQRALAAAQEGEDGGPVTDALVACAWAGRGDLLDLLLAAGARISVHTLAAAFPLRIGPAAFPGHFAPKLVSAERCDPLRAVRLLLARGAPSVPDCPVPHWHPLLRLIGDFKAERGEFGIQISEAPCPSGEHVPRSLFDDGLRDFEKMALTYLQIADALVDAGYSWPAVLPSVMLRGRWVSNYDPLQEPGLRAFLQGDARWLYRAIVRRPWSPASTQAAWPPRFRAAVRAVLMAAHRRSTPSSGAAKAVAGEAASGSAGTAAAPPRSPPSLSTLPRAGVLAIIGEAAYPLSAWRPRVVANADRLYSVFCGKGSLGEIGVEMASFLPGPGGAMVRIG